MSYNETDELEIVETLYKENRRQYYLEGVVLTSVATAVLFYFAYGSLAGIPATGDADGVPILLNYILAGLVTTLFISVRIRSDLPGLKPWMDLTSMLALLAVSLISVPVLGIILTFPAAIIMLPLGSLLKPILPVPDLNYLLAFGLGIAVAAVFTAGAITTRLSEDQEFALLSALNEPNLESAKPAVQVEHEPAPQKSTESVEEDTQIEDEGAPSDSTGTVKPDVQIEHEPAPSDSFEPTTDSEKLIDALQLWAEIFGESPSEEFVSVYGPYINTNKDSETASAYRKVFGSWEVALSSASLEPIDEQSRSRRTYTRLDILSAVKEVQDGLGERPSKTQLAESGTVSPETTIRRFGDWDTVCDLANTVPPIEADILTDLVETPVTFDRVTSLLDTTEQCLESAETQLAKPNFEETQSKLSTAKGRLTQVENEIDDSGFVCPDRYEALQGRLRSLQDSLKSRRVDFHLDTAEGHLEAGRSHCSADELESANQELSMVMEHLEEVDSTFADSDISLPERYDTLRSEYRSLQEAIEESIEADTDIEALEQELAMADECLDQCESHLSDDSLEAASTQLSRAQSHLSKIDEPSAVSDQYQTVQSRYESLQDMIEVTKRVDSFLDTSKKCLDTAEAHLSERAFDAATTQISTAKGRLTQAENASDDFEHLPSDRVNALRSRCRSLEESIETVSEIDSRLETAAKCLETAEAHLSDNEFSAARTQLSTAKGRLTQAENEIEHLPISLPDRYDTLRSHCQSLDTEIESEQQRKRAEKAIGSAVESMNAGQTAYEEGDLETAASKFDSVLDHLETVEKLPVDPGALATDETTNSIAARTAQGQVLVEMQRAEQQIALGHDAFEDREYEAAIGTYEDALSNLRAATGIARDHDLPQIWELEQRQDNVMTLLNSAKEQRDAADEHRVETATQRLDRVTRLTETAEQHLEVDDAIAAWEDTQQARDVVDDAFELLTKSAAETSDLEQRASELSERIEALAEDIPEQVRRDGTTVSASKRELLTYLQELSVIFGESPTEAFVDAYGIYPATAYLEIFDSWETALDEANLASIDEHARERRVYSRADILDAIVDLAETVESVPTPAQMNEQGAVSTATVEKRFETWETAVHLSGVDSQPTLDTVRELAGAENATASVPGDPETSETDTTTESDPKPKTDGTTTEPNTREAAATQNSHAPDDSIEDPTQRERSTSKSEQNSPALSTGEFADLTNFHRDLLVILAGLEGAKGLRIKDELEKYYDEEINHGRLYPNLDTLAERNLIEKFAINNRSNGYRLSKKGTRHLQKRRQWEAAHMPSSKGTARHDESSSPSTAKDDSPPDPRDATTVSNDKQAEAGSETQDNEAPVDTLVDDLLDDIEQLENEDA